MTVACPAFGASKELAAIVIALAVPSQTGEFMPALFS